VVGISSLQDWSSVFGGENNPAALTFSRNRLSLLAYNQRTHSTLEMAGMQSSPVEPPKTHAALVGRGGVGNYQEAKKWENVLSNDPPVKIDPVVHPAWPPLDPFS
jgi:hypothetical protein